MADDVDDLYALPPEEFVAARDALAKRLRADGDKDAAAAVKKLARPTVAAWALNQLPRRDPDAVSAVVEAGAELRRAQRRAMSGVKDAGMASAATARRDAVKAAARVAAQILSDAGKDPHTVEREISTALEAATTDPHVAEELEEGRFAKPPAPESDLGDLMALSLAAVDDAPGRQMKSGAKDEAKGKAADQAPADDAAERKRREHDERVEQARRKATAASKAAVEAEAAAAAVLQQAEAADEEAEDLRTRAERAAKEAKGLRRRAREAQSEADRRRQAAKAAAEALAELERG